MLLAGLGWLASWLCHGGIDAIVGVEKHGAVVFPAQVSFGHIVLI